MATVILRAPLKQRAGGKSSVEVDGATVRDVVAGLERDEPDLSGWVLDEQKNVRRHVNVFLNGERVQADASVGPDDRIEIIHAISGGAT